MSTNTDRVSAKIYQFPVRPRRVVADDRADTSIEIESQRICDAALGACWYHEAAVAESASLTQR